MGSEGCIHPTCDCSAYTDPGHPKGTLLLMRLGCKVCGHHASEHRRLTAVDRLVQEEVDRVAAVSCSRRVPLDEIPRSPVFRPHDPIPIPYDLEPDQAYGVQCACPGFNVPSLVKLWQSFRTHSLSTALTLLPQITCSSCSHTLQDHQPPPSPSSPATSAIPISSEGADINSRDRETEKLLEEVSGLRHPQLTLKASTRLALAPFKRCVQVLLETDHRGSVGVATVVSLHSPSEGEVHVLVRSEKLAESGEMDAVKLGSREDNGSDLRATKVIGTDNAAVNACEPEMTTKEPGNGSKESSKAKKGQRGRKRRRRVNLPPTRKSARLQKTVRKEDEETEARRLREVERAKERERVRGEQQVLCGRVMEFMSSLEDKSSFTHHPLPQDICKCEVEMMSVTRTGSGNLVLGLGTASGQVFVVSIREAGELVWCALDSGTSTRNRVKSLSWLLQSPHQLYLSAGYSGGSVAVWKVDTTHLDTHIEHSLVNTLQDTKADITLTSWAPDKSVLAVGSLTGQALFYLMSDSANDSTVHSHQFSQRLQCGGSALTCAVWMSNSRCTGIVAVGGTDDSIHILQRKQSPAIRTTTTPQQSSLFSFFKPLDADKFIYTHWFRGHCSFVSSLLCCGSRTLLSLGWDSHLLFWQDIEPIRLSDREVYPIEDNLPGAGFKLGVSEKTEYLPLSACAVGGLGVIVLFTNKTRDIDVAFYMFLPCSVTEK